VERLAGVPKTRFVPHYANRSIRPCSATTLAVASSSMIGLPNSATASGRSSPGFVEGSIQQAIAYPVHLARASVDKEWWL
jgi:hypothetical protein